MKLFELLNLNETIKNIIDDKDSGIDALIKFKLLGMMKAFEDTVQNFEIVRNEKIREFGEEGENGQISIDINNSEAVGKFNDALTPLLQSDVSVTIDKLKADDIFNCRIPANILVKLYDIIEQ